MPSMLKSFNATKLRAELKMAVSRLQIASNKRTAIVKQSMRAVAELLAMDQPQEEKARIKTESIIYDDRQIEAYEILMLECELLLERVKLIEFSKECPPDLLSCISTIIFASTRLDVQELTVVRKQFKSKYGRKFDEAALANEGGILNEKVVTKLSVEPPSAYLVQAYMEKICEAHEVDWKPDIKLTFAQMGEPMPPPVEYSVEVALEPGMTAATGLGEGSRSSSVPPPTGSLFMDKSTRSNKRNDSDDDNDNGGEANSLSGVNLNKMDIFNGGGGGVRMLDQRSAAPASGTTMATVTGVPEKITVAKGSFFNYNTPAPYAPSVSSNVSVLTTPQARDDELDNWSRANPPN